ncbi:HEAT repeat-containing protein [Euphorbia peplus]|nr:HEAT repeat-containing protein [Euphorbia peplus]
MASRDQALSLLTAANDHADLVVKLSSLKQAKDILLSLDPSLASELFPYLAELQFSPESLVRKMLVEMIEEIGLKAMENCSVLVPVLLAFLKDTDPVIARKAIVCGTHLFCGVLEEMALQFLQHNKVERWLEELWIWMLKFKDAVFAIAVEPGSVGTKLLSLKFLETYVLVFTSDTNEYDKLASEGSRRLFNVSWLAGGHPLLDPVALMSDADRTIRIFLEFLQSPGKLPGSLVIAAVNCLAAIARKRPLHYDTVLSALLEFEPNFETIKGCHPVSIQYSVRSAFLGFLRCMHPTIFESRDRLLRALRAMNAGDAADQVIRQVDKMIKNNERASREARFSRDDQASCQLSVPGDQLRKRSAPLENEELANGHDVPSKRIRYGPNISSNMPNQMNGLEEDSKSVNGIMPSAPSSDRDLTPAEQMVAMIGALLAEGERGAESLGILVSNIHPDLLADIVITNMKHLPKNPPPLTRFGNAPASRQMGSLSNSAQAVVAVVPSSTNSHSSVSNAPVGNSMPSEINTVNNFPADSKRDPRRDPRRLDPRRTASSVGGLSISTADDISASEPESYGSISLTKPVSVPSVTCVENLPEIVMTNNESHDKALETPLVPDSDQENLREEVPITSEDMVPISEVKDPSDQISFPLHIVNENSTASKLSDLEVTYDDDTPSSMELNQHSPTVSNTSIPEDTCLDLPQLPPYIDLTEEQKQTVKYLAVERIIESYKNLAGTASSLTRMALLARLVAQIDADDDIVGMLQKHIIVDYRLQKGHELVMHILYHLHSLVILDSVESSSYASLVYEKFLLVVAKSLLDTFPASDKSFSKLLGEVPHLPDSALKLLDDLCCSEVVDSHGKEVRDGERVTQGLGAVWGLILGRPNNRQACLDIALKCAVHSQDDIRAKAIRLVANKLYQLDYVASSIEQFATKMLLSAVHQHTSDTDLSQSGSAEQREGEVGSQETSISGSQVSDSGTFENLSMRSAEMVVQNASTMSPSEAQRLISLYFALCTQKPRLLQLVFDVYGRAPKAVKQAFHRHIPILLRALGSSYSELLVIISDPPEGCENLLMLVLQKLTQETTPSSDLIATVKHLYETKLKDATVLIPILSSLSKTEVLPIFPRLVGLPTEKFQMALAHILQGSAHTGPALTPAEVLVAIHDIHPEKDGLPLKKITDVCSACFEQRTVFTQQVLAKALNQMVDQTPLPLLFMRTVIQAIDAFPTLVDFVMEILSKLVSRQVWKMPKLWVGFLKCVSQTRPHSFHVLLQLPPPLLESAMNKYANLRGPLATYASQPTVRASLTRSTLAVLGIGNESQTQQSHVAPLQANSPSIQGSNLT